MAEETLVGGDADRRQRCDRPVQVGRQQHLDMIAAIDVLLIINHINAQSDQTASSDVDPSLLALVAQDAADATTGKRKT